jgi:hypothetical protein
MLHQSDHGRLSASRALTATITKRWSRSPRANELGVSIGDRRPLVLRVIGKLLADAATRAVPRAWSGLSEPPMAISHSSYSPVAAKC